VTDLGKALVLLGTLLTVVGALMLLASRVSWIGRLPGDIHVQRDTWSFYFPITTSIVISVVISLLLYLFGRR
jgi:membrane protein implicated in regulation of membrane protease activity